MLLVCLYICRCVFSYLARDGNHLWFRRDGSRSLAVTTLFGEMMRCDVMAMQNFASPSSMIFFSSSSMFSLKWEKLSFMLQHSKIRFSIGTQRISYRNKKRNTAGINITNS